MRASKQSTAGTRSPAHHRGRGGRNRVPRTRHLTNAEADERSLDCAALRADIFAGEHLLCARLRAANIDASAGALAEIVRLVLALRLVWPEVRITLRADSGFCRDASPTTRDNATELNSAFRIIWLKLRSGKCCAGKAFSHASDSKTGTTLERHASMA